MHKEVCISGKDTHSKKAIEERENRGCVGQWYVFVYQIKLTVGTRKIHPTIVMWPD